jgi:hypothetical protein
MKVDPFTIVLIEVLCPSMPHHKPNDTKKSPSTWLRELFKTLEVLPELIPQRSQKRERVKALSVLLFSCLSDVF